MIFLENTLIRNVFELTRRIREFLPNLVGKLDCCDKVAYTESKAHCDISSLVTLCKDDRVVASDDETCRLEFSLTRLTLMPLRQIFRYRGLRLNRRNLSIAIAYDPLRSGDGHF